MYGMPTNQKNLFTSYDALNNIYNPQAERKDIIDRDASMAIYEFAPGSQKTKDKVVHTAVGFAPSMGQTNLLKLLIFTLARNVNISWLTTISRILTIMTVHIVVSL